MTNSFGGYGAAGHLWRAVAVAIVSLMFISACGSKAQKINTGIPEPLARLVAVMPINNASGNRPAEKMLRDKVAEGIFLKGYQRIPLASVDEAIARINPPGGARANISLTPQRLREMSGVDGVLNIALSEANVKEGLAYVTVTFAASFELINARTGESLWKSNHRTVKRGVALSRGGRERMAYSIFEEGMDALVEAGLSSLPEGPILFEGAVKKNK